MSCLPDGEPAVDLTMMEPEHWIKCGNWHLAHVATLASDKYVVRTVN